MSKRRGNAIRDKMTEILTYHNFSNNGSDQWTITPSLFESDMKWLVEQGYKGVSLKDFYEDIEQEKVFVLTFDDGYRDFFDVAMPILDKLNFKATIFIVSGLIGFISCWRTADLQPPLLNWDEIRNIANAGYEIGSHGVYHSDLFRLSREKLDQEIIESRKLIEGKLGVPVVSFSYSWNRCNDEIVSIVREARYKYAVIHGRKSRTDFKGDRFRLRRRGMNNKNSVKEFIT